MKAACVVGVIQFVGFVFTVGVSRVVASYRRDRIGVVADRRRSLPFRELDGILQCRCRWSLAAVALFG